MGFVVAGQTVTTTSKLLAPHHVESIAPGEIVRRYPAPGAVDVESNYFPLIEFAAPDLPWRYTPGSTGLRGTTAAVGDAGRGRGGRGGDRVLRDRRRHSAC